MHFDPAILQFLAAPFVASLILTGIHTYLGVHVVERGVIFVDLSLAQIAALGATMAMLLPFSGGDPHAPGVYWFSLGFTFIGAAVFSLIHHGQKSRIPQEAVIGIAYAVASAASILAMSQSTAQGEHLGHAGRQHPRRLVDEVFKTAALYCAIGLFHFINRRRFLLISMDPIAHGGRRFTSVWDFLFYASFGFVVTSSVSIAGVLLVFCYLIVPSVAAMLYAEGIGTRLAIGWSMGTIVSVLGMYFSVAFDPPRRHHRLYFGAVLIAWRR